LYCIVLSYGSETWTIRTDERRLISADMRFLRTAGYTGWDHKRNEDILTELQISQITNKIINNNPWRYRL
jgi:hypothetical protein